MRIVFYPEGSVLFPRGSEARSPSAEAETASLEAPQSFEAQSPEAQSFEAQSFEAQSFEAQSPEAQSPEAQSLEAQSPEAPRRGTPVSPIELGRAAELDGRMAEFWRQIDLLNQLRGETSGGSQQGNSHPPAGPPSLRAALHGVESALAEVHPDLDFEWFPAAPRRELQRADQGSAKVVDRLVVRARGARELYPLVEQLCSRRRVSGGDRARAGAELVPCQSAFSDTTGIQLVPLLPALGHEVAVARASACWAQDLASARVRVGFVRGHLLELVFSIPGCYGHADVAALEAATVYAEAALGERVLDEWVGNIGVAPAARGGPLLVLDSQNTGATPTHPLRELSDLVERARLALLAGLPAERLAAEPAGDWTLLDSEPLLLPGGATGDSPHMHDVLMAATRCPELVKCYLEGLPVSSARFSRVGEVFCYVKLPCDQPLAERPVIRQRVEAALEHVLAEAGVIIGNAVGLGHVYVLLALSGLEGGLARLLAADTSLRQLLPRGTKLLFMDAVWQNEWVDLA